MSTELSEKISRALARNRIAREVFRQDGDVYLVGGFIRDIAIGMPSHDLDFVIGGKGIRHVVEAAHAVFGGTVVELRKEHIIRIAHRDGRTIDFSRFEGSIEGDLLSRDFSMNAIAWSPKTGLIDPSGGIADIAKSSIRGIFKQNFKNDALRLFRTYRFASQLGWHVEPETKGWVRSLGKLVTEPAKERLTQELCMMLAGKAWDKGLHEAFEDGLLARIIPLKSADLGANIKLLSRISARLDKSRFRNTFKFSDMGLRYEGVLMLEGLLCGADIGRCHLALSSEIARRITLINALFDAYESVEAEDSNQLFDLLIRAGSLIPDIIILTGRLDLLPAFKRFERIESSPLVTSQELMEHTGIGPSKRLGNLLRELKRLRFKGSIKTHRDALNWAGFHKKLI